MLITNSQINASFSWNGIKVTTFWFLNSSNSPIKEYKREMMKIMILIGYDNEG